MKQGSCGINNDNQHLPIFALFLFFVLFGCLIYNEAIMSIAEFPFSNLRLNQETQNNVVGMKNNPLVVDKSNKGDEEIKLPPEECDLFDGKWVLDKVSHPLYKESECPTLWKQVTCLSNGRKDSLFQNWRWQPKHCSLPKFEARLLLEKLRNKRLLFVGDSIGRNQFDSMLCMVQSVVPQRRTTSTGNLNVFPIPDYNATIEFYWAPFLVESNSDDPEFHRIKDRLILPESIEKHAKHWKNADILIFNVYIWWKNSPKVLRGSFEEGSKEYDEIAGPISYTRVLNTWSNWVDQNTDPNRNQVFFMSMSPIHINGSDWHNPDGIQCEKETAPILDTSMQFDVGTDERLFEIAASVTKSMRTPVHFMNITRMSEYRKDAHSAMYGVYGVPWGTKQTPEQKKVAHADCLHWCLPGLPDTWNELLYAKIISSS